jgi:hypothetical protein
MFFRLRLFYNKRLFLTFNKDLYRLMDDWAAGRCSEDFFIQKSQELFRILEVHFDRAFALSRKVDGVPDLALSTAMETTRKRFEQSRFKQSPAAPSPKEEKPQPTGAGPQNAPEEITVELANRYLQRSEDEMNTFIEQALKECRAPDGSLNGQALFVRLLESFLRDEFLKTAEELNGRPPRPSDLVNAQLKALEECNIANSYCFKEGQFRRFRVMVEQNLNPQKFFEEHSSIYDEVTKSLRKEDERA